MKPDLLSAEEIPSWFAYPTDFLSVVQSGLRDIGAWQVLDGKWLRIRHEGLKKRFPDRDLVPFARRLDCDDVACWDSKSSPSVEVVHDFSAPGWEERDSFPSFQAWLLAAQEEAKGYDE
jgi:hypothetical protein